MLVVLKIPMVYLAAVVWWAIRAEPASPGFEEPARSLAPLVPCGWDEHRRRRGTRRGPNLRPSRNRPLAPAGRARAAA